MHWGLILGSILFNTVDLNGDIKGMPTQLSDDTKLGETENASYGIFRILKGLNSLEQWTNSNKTTLCWG